ncbi:MAG TPA: MarR family transcriptional regulator [Ktedonobacterales bacterium]|nr:MarR family transcriptional regulator [Ktedonobacterales bacterium]
MSTLPPMEHRTKIVQPDVSEISDVEEAPPTFTPRVEGHQKGVRQKIMRHIKQHVHGCEGVANDGQAPSPAKLAEALFATTQALKSTGRLCMEEADPTLRAISLPRARVLMVMDDVKEGLVRMSDLSVALGVTPRNVTTIVDGLEREGLIARTPDPTDRRAILLELTPKGQEHIAEVHAMQHSIAERFFAPLSAEERTYLVQLLVKIWDGVHASGHMEQS